MPVMTMSGCDASDDHVMSGCDASDDHVRVGCQ